MKAISEAMPKPHSKYYAVLRDGKIFTATPCYGMHHPWWVVRTMAPEWPNEADPVAMLDTDRWCELTELIHSLPVTLDGQELTEKSLEPAPVNQEAIKELGE